MSERLPDSIIFESVEDINSVELVNAGISKDVGITYTELIEDSVRIDLRAGEVLAMQACVSTDFRKKVSSAGKRFSDLFGGTEEVSTTSDITKVSVVNVAREIFNIGGGKIFKEAVNASVSYVYNSPNMFNGDTVEVVERLVEMIDLQEQFLHEQAEQVLSS